MKKVLLGTSALALAGAFASPAASAEWSMRVGGYMEQFVAYADSDASFDGDFDGIDSKQDAEIWFLPSITLDNGIKIGANVQLEAFQNSDQIDESYMFIKGSFGEILLGSENSAGYKMTYAAPDVSFLNVNSGSTVSFIPWSGGGAGSDVFRRTLGSSYLENVGNNDAQRFTYFSPRFAGLQIGLSYARDGFQDTNAQVDVDSTLSDIFDVGANYVNSFGDFNVAISGRWGIGDAPSGFDNPTLWVAGLNLGFGGFTVGGSYGEQNKASAIQMNGEVFDVGASYTTGPWGFSVTYFRGENQDNDGPGDETVDQFLVALSYDLAKGVNIGAYGAFVDFEEDDHEDDVDGFIIGTGVKIKF
ncbi:MAG: porin [Paracoccaceae bacterium]